METVETLQKTVDAQQAEIDRLMFEFCPQKMTPEQVERYTKAQKPVFITAKEFTAYYNDNHGRIGIGVAKAVVDALKHYEENVKPS